MDFGFSENVDTVPWEELAEVFERALLGKRFPDELETAFTNSQVRCFLFHKGHVVGAARALSDGINQAAIYDVALLPEYQGRGNGCRMIEFILGKLKFKTVILFAVPGKEGFYEKLSFRKMKTAMGIFTNPEAQRQGYIE